MYIGTHAKYLLFLSDFIKTSIFSRDFRKNTRWIKFHENPSSGSRVVPCGWTDRHYEANIRYSQFCDTPLKNHSLSGPLGEEKNLISSPTRSQSSCSLGCPAHNLIAALTEIFRAVALITNQRIRVPWLLRTPLLQI